MHDYELIEVDQAGVRRGETFPAPNDEEAVQRAMSVSEALAMEVWRDGRKIRSYTWLVA